MAEDSPDGFNQDEMHNPKSDGTNPSDNARPNGSGKRPRTGSDPDAQEMVISSLRSQIQDLFSQVAELNNKLVKSYDRVSDLEDDLHVASSNLRSSSIKISQLELERTQHLSALNTGLLVEKSHVTSELNRLMEKATEEAAQRGQAETARADIEKDLDDLSATLFGQANTMVAEARYAQHLSERKVEEAERALKGTEEVVGMMQQQMQALQADKELAEQKAQEMQMTMGKGKWVDREDSSSSILSIRLLSSHVPYQEFLLFVAHLRSVHPSSPQPPAMTTLLPLPFLARLLNEDSEPTVRLDLAPSLNWLSRRSVLSAIHNGQLTIEPMPSGALLQESSSYSSSTNIPGLNSSSNNISCALCGTPVFSDPESNYRRSKPQPSTTTHSNSTSLSWSTALFKKPPQPSYSASANSSQLPILHSSNYSLHQPYPSQIYIFRLAPPASGASSIPITSLSKPISSSVPPQHPDHHPPTNYANSSPQSATIYPLCASGWCLARLRATCILWAFVRTNIVEKVWEEEVPSLPPPSTIPTPRGEKPPIPPRRRGLWGMASALGERAASWSEGDKDKAKKVQPPIVAAGETETRKLPPPPTHPSVGVIHAHSNNLAPAPPPLPKRSEVRVRQASPKFDHDVKGAQVHDISRTPPAVDLKSTVESPPASVCRSTTPTNIPLPESRSPTPPVAGITPSRAASPALGNAVPPPLPKRAAARAPRLMAQGGSRPVTPVNGNIGTRGATDTKAETNAIEDMPAKAAEPVASDQDHTPPPEGEARAGPDSENLPTVDQVAEVEASETAVTDTTVPPSSTEDVLMDIEMIVGSEDAKDKEVGKDDPVILKTDTPTNDVDALVNGDKETKHEEDNEVYIGDATWEERTWKELVRLREEMFWARVGGLK